MVDIALGRYENFASFNIFVIIRWRRIKGVLARFSICVMVWKYGYFKTIRPCVNISRFDYFIRKGSKKLHPPITNCVKIGCILTAHENVLFLSASEKTKKNYRINPIFSAMRERIDSGVVSNESLHFLLYYRLTCIILLSTVRVNGAGFCSDQWRPVPGSIERGSNAVSVHWPKVKVIFPRIDLLLFVEKNRF